MAKRKKKKGGKSGGKASRQEAPTDIAPATAQEPARQRTAPKRTGHRGSVNKPLLVLSLAGMLLTAYLAQVSFSGAALPYCEEGSACDVVQQSRWGSFFGIPTSLLGFGVYFLLGWSALRAKNIRRHWQIAWMIALLGLAYSIYLTVISLAVIEATCLYCLVSLGLMAGIVGLLVWQRPDLAGFSWPVWGGQTALVALVVVVGMHAYYSGWIDPATGPEDPYLRGLASHLAQSGAIFYGAYW